MKLDLLVSIDSRISTYILPLVRSIAANCPRARLTVLQTGLSDDQLEVLQKSLGALLEARFIRCEPNITQRPVQCPLTSRAVFNRIFAIEILPDLHKALYLDVDTIVLQDVGELFEEETGECGLAGVLDYFEPTLQEQLNDFYLNAPIEFPATPIVKAFNSGVLLMDFKKLREQHAFAWMTRQLREHYMLDQPLLNLYSRGRFKTLDKRWNRSANYIQSSIPVDEIGILHWHGKKPWNEVCPFQNVYEDYVTPSSIAPTGSRHGGRLPNGAPQ